MREGCRDGGGTSVFANVLAKETTQLLSDKLYPSATFFRDLRKEMNYKEDYFGY
jgi:hypothetical protein